MKRSVVSKLVAGLTLMPCLMGAAALAQLPSQGFPDVDVPISQLDEDYLRVGRYVQAATISRVHTGANAEEVTRLLGSPEQVDRYSGRQEWYYSINLPLADGINQLVCQYRVDVDATLSVVDTQWRRSQCRTLFGEFIGSLQMMNFSADVLFKFDSAELEPEGMQELYGVALLLNNQYETPVIHIAGHTDRIGRDDYNMGLSQRRANAVQTFLQSQGLPASQIRAEGRGMHEPVAICLGTRVTQELKDCLAPNRRVTLNIAETSREG